MGSSTLIEVFGHIVFSFTRGVTEHYNPEEPEFTAESFGYNPLESTGREWYYHPVEEVIYQEYSDRELTSLDYLASSSLHVRVVDASSPGENEEGQEAQQDEDRAMAWKRLRPSALRTVCKSIYIGALISPLTATFIGTLYMLVSYLCYKTTLNCQFHQKNSTSVEVQWFRTISDVIFSTFTHIWYFVNLLFLFRPFQLMGVKRKLILVCFLFYFVESVYRVAVQAFGISRSKASPLEEIALYVFFSLSVSLQVYLVVDHFWRSPTREKFILFLQMTVPGCSPVILGTLIYYLVYPTYTKQTSQGKLLIALFVPLIGVVIKAICRVCVQRLWNISHPGYSHVLLAPLYFGSAVLCRVLQADLESLQSIAILGIIHGASEVIERSTVVVIDHICHLIWKRKSAPWGSFRTPRCERLMADIAIMSMMFESTAIVSVNGFLYLFQFVYLRNISFINLLQSFAIHTSVQLVIEWCFTSVSLAIETRYQNMAVMAVWRRRWKRHIFVAIVNAVPLAIWTSSTQVVIVRGRFEATISQECKIPFT